MDIVVAALSDARSLTDLAQDAERDGHRMVSHLISEWTDGTNRFAKPGESLYIAREGEQIVGVCGLNVDPYLADPAVGRVRRLYVAVASRRSRVGTVLVDRIVADARDSFDTLRLRTRNPVAAAFYESHGFVPVAGDEVCTHQLRLDG
jgi:GNAT superfamily N-acetyltransferase